MTRSRKPPLPADGRALPIDLKALGAGLSLIARAIKAEAFIGLGSIGILAHSSVSEGLLVLYSFAIVAMFLVVRELRESWQTGSKKTKPSRKTTTRS